MPGRSKKAYADWLTQRGDHFRAGIGVAALDPFGGYKAAIDEQLADATAVLDAFHVVKLGTAVVDEVRRRVQQATLGHRGRKGDPLYGIATILRAGAENLTDKQWVRLAVAIDRDEAHQEVFVAWQCAQQPRAAYKNQRHPRRPPTRREDPRLAPHLSDPRSRPTRPHPTPLEERLPRLLRHRPGKQWRH